MRTYATTIPDTCFQRGTLTCTSVFHQPSFNIMRKCTGHTVNNNKLLCHRDFRYLTNILPCICLGCEVFAILIITSVCDCVWFVRSRGRGRERGGGAGQDSWLEIFHIFRFISLHPHPHPPPHSAWFFLRSVAFQTIGGKLAVIAHRLYTRWVAAPLCTSPM